MPTAAETAVPPSVAKKKRLNCMVLETYACCTFLTPATTTVSPSTRTMAVSSGWPLYSAMRGAEKNNPTYSTRQNATLKKNTDEKSRSSGSFFWMREFAMPLSTKTSMMEVMIVTLATSP